MAAFVVGGITLILILIPPVLHRRRSGEDLPVQTRYNLPIEILYTVMPLMVIAVLFFYTARDEDQLTQNPAEPDQTVGVIGYRWSWAFNYVDEQTYDIGSPQTLPTLWVPVGETIRFELNSPDVIHSFWVPSFVQKLDVIPGRQNVLTLTPTVEGSYRGKCAELCGVDHARMLFDVQVVSQEEFEDHMEDLRQAGQTGQLETGRVDTSGSGKAGRTEIGGGS
jgi:cytochrome c oxidase subunit 2